MKVVSGEWKESFSLSSFVVESYRILVPELYSGTHHSWKLYFHLAEAQPRRVVRSQVQLGNE